MQNAANAWRRWAAVACFAVIADCATEKPRPPDVLRDGLYCPLMLVGTLFRSELVFDDGLNILTDEVVKFRLLVFIIC